MVLIELVSGIVSTAVLVLVVVAALPFFRICRCEMVLWWHFVQCFFLLIVLLR